MIRTINIPCPLCGELLLDPDDWWCYYCPTKALYENGKSCIHYYFTAKLEADYIRYFMRIFPYEITSYEYKYKNTKYSIVDKFNKEKDKFTEIIDTRELGTSGFIKPDKEHIVIQKIKTILTFS